MSNDDVFEEFANVSDKDAERFFLDDGNNDRASVVNVIPGIQEKLNQSPIAAKDRQKKQLERFFERFLEFGKFGFKIVQSSILKTSSVVKIFNGSIFIIVFGRGNNITITHPEKTDSQPQQEQSNDCKGVERSSGNEKTQTTQKTSIEKNNNKDTSPPPPHHFPDGK